jgi:hypothetical protein
MKDPDAKRLGKRLDISYAHALRLVRQARQLADERKISYPEAERHIIETYATAATPAAPSFVQLLRDEIEAACIELAYQEVEYEIDERPARGLPFGDVPLPRDVVDNISVELVEPDLHTLTWSVDQEFEGGTQVANVELAANVIFDGYVHKSVAYHLADEGDGDISVVDLDWNDQMSRVSFARLVTLAFHAVLGPDLPAVDNLEFIGASDAIWPLSNPHSPL